MITQDFPSCYYSSMRNLAGLFIHLLATLARLLGPGGVRSIVAETLLLKHQLLILNRSRKRSPNLSASDRIFAGWLALWVRPTRLLRSAIALKPSTLLGLHNPLYRFHQWQANLRILEVTEIKSIPYVPLSHPFVERLIGTLRREYLDHMLFWTTADLENKLLDFRSYFNHHRTHTSREGRPPDPLASQPAANLSSFRWQPHCRALYQTPVAA